MEYITIKCKKGKVARLMCNSAVMKAKCPGFCDCELKGRWINYSRSDICKKGVVPEIDGSGQAAPLHAESPLNSSGAGTENKVNRVKPSERGESVSPSQPGGYSDIDSLFMNRGNGSGPGRYGNLSSTRTGESPSVQPARQNGGVAHVDPANVPPAPVMATNRVWRVSGKIFNSVGEALNFIFEHWLTYEVFQNNRVKEYFMRMTEEYVTSGINVRAEIERICQEEGDINYKFFLIFYTCVFPESTNFCYSEKTVTGRGQTVTPIFNSEDDLWNELYFGRRNIKFFVKLKPALERYLKLENGEDFFSEATIKIYERFGALCVFVDVGDTKKMINFGNINQFVSKLPAASSAIGTEFEEALRIVSVGKTTTGFAVDCGKPAISADEAAYLPPIPEDAALGWLFSARYSSVYATLWKRHAMFVNYCVNGLNLERIVICDGFAFTRRGFYGELERIVTAAVSEKDNKKKKAALAMLGCVRGLVKYDFKRDDSDYCCDGGALGYYVKNCENEKIEKVVSAIRRDCSAEEIYHIFRGTQGVILRNDGAQTVMEYIQSLASDTAMGTAIANDRDLQTFLKPVYEQFGQSIDRAMVKYGELEKRYRSLYSCV